MNTMTNETRDLAEWEAELVGSFRVTDDIPQTGHDSPIIVGLAGKKRAGKSTVADFLAGEYGFHELAFAEKLKRVAYNLNPHIFAANGMALRDLVDGIGWDVAKAIPDVRWLLQDLGSALRRGDPDYWVRDVLDGLKYASRAVVSDVRYPNEAEAVLNAGGIILEIVRPELRDDDPHESESGVSDYVTTTVMNVGTLADLRRDTLATLRRSGVNL